MTEPSQQQHKQANPAGATGSLLPVCFSAERELSLRNTGNELPVPPDQKTATLSRKLQSNREGKGNAKAVAGVGGVVLIAWLLSGLFNGFGLGPGDGTGTGKDGDPNNQANVDPNTQPVSTTDVDVGDVVNVLIDDDRYLILKSPGDGVYDVANYLPISLEKIVEKAQSVSGDSGVKVRIRMRSNAVALTENKLNDALQNAGIIRTAITEDEQTVP